MLTEGTLGTGRDEPVKYASTVFRGSASNKKELWTAHQSQNDSQEFQKAVESIQKR